jgi:hypothetical protein
VPRSRSRREGLREPIAPRRRSAGRLPRRSRSCRLRGRTSIGPDEAIWPGIIRALRLTNRVAGTDSRE